MVVGFLNKLWASSCGKHQGGSRMLYLRSKCCCEDNILILLVYLIFSGEVDLCGSGKVTSIFFYY